MQKRIWVGVSFGLMVAACGPDQEEKKAENAGKADTIHTRAKETVDLPAPYATKSVANFCEVVGWPAGKMPIAPKGFTVSKFAAGMDNPRWIYVARNGDVFVAESSTESGGIKKFASKISGQSKSQNSGQSANRITLLRDTNHDGIADFRTVFLSDLNRPFGMLIIGNKFYVANTDGVVVYPYGYGQSHISGKGHKIVTLPAGGYNNHWTRNIITNNDSSKIFVTVGSGSNVGENGMENEVRRACILQLNPDGTGERIYAGGLRNPQGMDWAPETNTLWVAVNERDELGDQLVPDYLAGTRDGGFYGWPFSYWGQHEDPRLKDKQRPDLVRQAIVPDVDMGAHTASLGLAFDKNKLFTTPFGGGAFVGQHGSWNRAAFSGYEVSYVPFHAGKPAGERQPFLTGFIADSTAKKVYGRPVGVAFTSSYLLVADDSGNTVWSVKTK